MHTFNNDQLAILRLYLPQRRIDQLTVEMNQKATADEAMQFARDAVNTAKGKRETAWMSDAAKTFNLEPTNDGEITL